MTFGEAGKEQARVHDLETVKSILDIFQSHGHYEVSDFSKFTYKVTHYNQIDTARIYSGGTSEEYLGKIDWQKRGLVMDTKLYPIVSGYACKSFCHSLINKYLAQCTRLWK